MKNFRWLAWMILFLVTACQPISSSVTIIDGGHIQRIESTERDLIPLLTQAGIDLGQNDRVFVNGIPTPLDQTQLEAGSLTIQIRRAVGLTLTTPQGQQTIQTSALTVGQALTDADFSLTKNDLIDPPAETPITQNLTVTYTPVSYTHLTLPTSDLV